MGLDAAKIHSGGSMNAHKGLWWQVSQEPCDARAQEVPSLARMEADIVTLCLDPVDLFGPENNDASVGFYHDRVDEGRTPGPISGTKAVLPGAVGLRRVQLAKARRKVTFGDCCGQGIHLSCIRRRSREVSTQLRLPLRPQALKGVPPFPEFPQQTIQPPVELLLPPRIGSDVHEHDVSAQARP